MTLSKSFVTVTQCCCPRGKSLSLSSRTNLQVHALVLGTQVFVLVLEPQVLVLVLVVKPQVLVLVLVLKPQVLNLVLVLEPQVLVLVLEP